MSPDVEGSIPGSCDSSQYDVAMASARVKHQLNNGPHPQRWRNALIAAALGLATIIVYWRAVGNEFVQYDDTDYVLKNLAVQAGLTRHGFTYAFTTNAASNWHPLTWLSYMLDCQLWGVNAA